MNIMERVEIKARSYICVYGGNTISVLESYDEIRALMDEETEFIELSQVVTYTPEAEAAHATVFGAAMSAAMRGQEPIVSAVRARLHRGVIAAHTEIPGAPQ